MRGAAERCIISGVRRPSAVTPLRAVLLAAFAASALGAAPGGGADKLHGAYTVRGAAVVRASPVLDDRVDVDVAVLVAAGDRKGQLAVHLSSAGYACDLRATLQGGDVLAFAPGQTCALEIEEANARGPVEARLRAGRGRLRDGILALELAWDVTGEMSLQVGGQRVEVLGREVEVPAAWAPRVPVRGTVDARAEGPRAASSEKRAGAPGGAPARSGAR